MWERASLPTSQRARTGGTPLIARTRGVVCPSRRGRCRAETGARDHVSVYAGPVSSGDATSTGLGDAVSVRHAALKELNGVLRPVGLQLIRSRSADPAIKDFIRARPTLAAAKAANLSLTDYIDTVYAQPGTTAATVQAMLGLAQLAEPVQRVCEIGPGSGRYAEKVIA